MDRIEDFQAFVAIVDKGSLTAAAKQLKRSLQSISRPLATLEGDLGVELPLEMVPGLQKRIVRGTRRLGRPVVVATQMLESMIASPVPRLSPT